MCTQCINNDATSQYARIEYTSQSSFAQNLRLILTGPAFQQAFGSPYRLIQVPQIRPLAYIVHSKYRFT